MLKEMSLNIMWVLYCWDSRADSSCVWG